MISGYDYDYDDVCTYVLALQCGVGVLPPSALIFVMCDNQQAAIKLAHRVLTHKPSNPMDRVVAGLVQIDTTGRVLIAWLPAEHDTHSHTVLAQVNRFVDARAKQAVSHPDAPMWTWPSVWCDMDTLVGYKGGAPMMNVKAACKELPIVVPPHSTKQLVAPNLVTTVPCHQDVARWWRPAKILHPTQKAVALLVAFYRILEPLYLGLEGEGVRQRCLGAYSCSLLHQLKCSSGFWTSWHS